MERGWICAEEIEIIFMVWLILYEQANARQTRAGPWTVMMGRRYERGVGGGNGKERDGGWEMILTESKDPLENEFNQIIEIN